MPPAKFYAARAIERRRRLIAYLPHAEALGVVLQSGLVVSVHMAHHTQRIRYELQFVNNAFLLRGGEALKGDILNFIWRHHPLFRRRDGSFPNAVGPIGLTAAVRSTWAKYRLIRRLRNCDVEKTSLAVRDWLAALDQDKPAQPVKLGQAKSAAVTAREEVAPEINEWDDLADYFARYYYIDPFRLLDYPRALLWQMLRNHTLAQPEGELAVFAPSDALLTARE